MNHARVGSLKVETESLNFCRLRVHEAFKVNYMIVSRSKLSYYIWKFIGIFEVNLDEI